MDEEQRQYDENRGNVEPEEPETMTPVPMNTMPEPPEDDNGEPDMSDMDNLPPELAIPESQPINRFQFPSIRPPRISRALENVGEFAGNPVISVPESILPSSAPPENKETVEEFVNVSPEDEDFLTGTDDELIDLGKDPSDFVNISEKDNRYLFGGADDVIGMPKRKVRYSVGNSRGKKRPNSAGGEGFLSRPNEF